MLMSVPENRVAALRSGTLLSRITEVVNMSGLQLSSQKSLILLVFLLAAAVCVLPVAAEETMNHGYSFWTPDTVYIGHPTEGYGQYYEDPSTDQSVKGDTEYVNRPLQWSVNTTGVLDILQPESKAGNVFLRGISPGTVKITVSDPETSWTNSSVVSVEQGVVVETREEAETYENSSRYVQTPTSLLIESFNEPDRQMGSTMIAAWIQDQFDRYYSDEIVWTSSNPDVTITSWYSEAILCTKLDEATTTITATSRSHPELTNSTVVTVYSSRLVPSLWVQSTIPAGRPVNVTLMVSVSEDTEGASLRLTDETGELWNATVDLNDYWSENVPVTLAEGTHTLTFTVTGAEKTVSISETVTAKMPILSVTEQNKETWNGIYGYDRTYQIGAFGIIGTYFTSDTGMEDIPYIIDFGEDTDRLVSDTDQLSGTLNVFNSSSNMLYLQAGPLESVGEFPYTITLGNSAVVGGTFTVTDVPVDIKVLESAVLAAGSGSGSLPDLAVYNREFSNTSSRQLEIAVSAGTAGRTMQGLEYLIGYPHGCPEQVTSPMLAAVQMKNYYKARGLLTDSLNTTIRASAQKAINEYLASPDGADAQQINGGWAWGTSSTPSVYYTAYPMYGIAVLMNDIRNDPEFWTNKDAINLAGVDLNESTRWLNENTDMWDGSSYYIPYAVQALDASLPYLDDEAAQDARDLLNSSAIYLRDYPVSEWEKAGALISLVLSNKTAQDPTLAPKINEYARDLVTLLQNDNGYAENIAQAVYGLVLLENPTYEPAIQKGVESLTKIYGTNGRWYNTYTTGVVIRAMNAATAGESSLTDPVEVTVAIEGLESQTLTLTKLMPSNRVTLSGAALDGLYGDTPGDLTRTVSVTKPADPKVLVSVTSKEQMPKSVAYSDGDGYDPIPDEHIDPIATDLFLTVTNPGPVDMGTEQDIIFVGENTKTDPLRGVMILEIQTGDKLRFNTTEHGVTGTAAEYGRDGRVGNFRHMYGEATGKLYVYPGSDDDSKVVIPAGGTKEFCVPLEFPSAGPATIAARLSHMDDDEWMALGNTTVSVTGTGSLTISAYDAEYQPLTEAEFELMIDDSQVDISTGAVYINNSVREGTYKIKITNDSRYSVEIPNLVFNAGTDLTYSVYFAPDGVVYSGNDGPTRRPVPTPTPSDNGGSDNGAELLAAAGVKPPAAPTKVPAAESTRQTEPSATDSGQPASGETPGSQTTEATPAATTAATTGATTATPTETQASLPVAGILAGLGVAAVLLRRP